MKTDRIDDKPSESKPPLNQAPNPPRRNPALGNEESSAPSPLFLYNLGCQHRPPTSRVYRDTPHAGNPYSQTWRTLKHSCPSRLTRAPDHRPPRPARTPCQVELLQGATCQGLAGRITTFPDAACLKGIAAGGVRSKGHPHSQGTPQRTRTPAHKDTGEGAHDGHGHPDRTRDLCDSWVLIPAMDGRWHQS